MSLVLISCIFINGRFAAQKLVLARISRVNLSCAHRHLMLLWGNNSVEFADKKRAGGGFRDGTADHIGAG
jgi:hypothetical protein